MSTLRYIAFLAEDPARLAISIIAFSVPKNWGGPPKVIFHHRWLLQSDPLQKASGTGRDENGSRSASHRLGGRRPRSGQGNS